ncbi:hypothetical protein SAMN04488120_10185 [Fontimonas thermophila]|uniref:Uncharacterized protein n=1 Tax=Fontimonas thermophila TaxID=1076937 RepID=A0A1I2H1E5_9GAMM|nr:hypothetical protein [Fontimonas thermophila]SFF23502.1 hypothetical protein SAMN04488120_10185 [Fontimonas thermophila]
MIAHDRRGIAEEAARIICVEHLIDYGLAKRKAVQRLGLPPGTPLPDNAAVQDAVVEYQRLFGGDAYRRQLARMRATAVAALRLFARHSPRLVGATISGAITPAHRVQLHVFCDAVEEIDVELIDRGVAFEQGERRYCYPHGGEQRVPLLRLEFGGIGVDVAVFPVDEIRRAPINPFDGRPYRRIDLAEAERLAGP